jgi:mannose-6-phosphate isomerase-like protein (cupin superfamily)
MKKVDKSWGYEEWYVNNDMYCCKHLHLNKGYMCSIHYHKEKDETFYILKGKVKMELFGETRIMKEGDSLRLNPYTLHRFIGLEDSIILEVSTTHKDYDSYRVVVGGKSNI